MKMTWFLSSLAALLLTSTLLVGTAWAQSAPGAQHAGTDAAPWNARSALPASTDATSATAAPSRVGRAARKTAADAAMNTSGSNAGSTPTGPDTTTPDAQATSDLTGSTGASIGLGAAPAPPSPAPPGGAPSGGLGPQ